MYDMIIVGAGTAGLTAGIYALRSGVKPLILECEAMGGQITLSPCVENYPGIAKISGMEFADGLMAQLTNLGGEVTYGRVISARKIDNGCEVCTEDGETYEGKNLIIASGAAHRHLGIEREQELIGRGVSYCAVCDGPFFKEKTAAVVGGGSAALQDALYLADICRHVTVIHRRSDFRADPILVERAEKTANLTLLRSTVVEALEGSERLTGLTLRNTAVGEVSHLPVSALFQAVGLLPESRLARSLGVPVDEAGFIAAGEDCLTPIPGIFAAGDLRAKEVRQLTTACADGAVAALSACRFCV